MCCVKNITVKSRFSLARDCESERKIQFSEIFVCDCTCVHNGCWGLAVWNHKQVSGQCQQARAVVIYSRLVHSRGRGRKKSEN